ncbi:MAG: 50S ribosomal protein L29 [Candidatus Magasanikbacteria bacterium RIFCSPHIGHO2_02_FULL_51_14]|uniref:Large ribosomal subunit protein uL29 n=1 Tax=Candidatus Magasanikbacteria bacterium RIFCSPHIGHO2_02_FULL_51_14 TaxID=1798683 RepID=A0A1F6MHK8_9BACT|nr:MAG: 50S ribosomal protein L29 [Candidatus Magasanikbacteria bacterium RIFCSPHIGHO2_02_FULL_51_14]
MEIADLKRKTEKDLRELLREKRTALRELRFQAGEGQLKDVREIREARKAIAQILTLLNQKKAVKNEGSPVAAPVA